MLINLLEVIVLRLLVEVVEDILNGMFCDFNKFIFFIILLNVLLLCFVLVFFLKFLRENIGIILFKEINLLVILLLKSVLFVKGVKRILLYFL